MNVHRLLAAVGGLPFIEAGHGQQAAAALEGGPEGGLFGRRLGPGVDHLRTDGRLLGPRRDETPLEKGEFALAGAVQPHGGHGLRGGHVIAGHDKRHFGQLIVGGHLFPGGCQSKSAAHTVSSGPPVAE